MKMTKRKAGSAFYRGVELPLESVHGGAYNCSSEVAVEVDAGAQSPVVCQHKSVTYILFMIKRHFNDDFDLVSFKNLKLKKSEVTFVLKVMISLDLEVVM